MTFSFYTHFDNIGKVLSAASIKQKETTNNIANAHTPDYTAKSTSFSEILSSTNQTFEIPLSKKMGKAKGGLGPSDTGQPVSLRTEMVDLQKNSLIFSLATRRMAAIFNGLKAASQIGR